MLNIYLYISDMLFLQPMRSQRQVMLRPRKFRWLQRQSVRPIWPPPMSPLCRLCTRPWMWCRRTTNCQSWWCGSWRKLLSRGNCIARMDTTMRQSTIVLCLSLQDKRNLQSSSVFLRGISRFHAQGKVSHMKFAWISCEYFACEQNEKRWKTWFSCRIFCLYISDFD